MAYFEELNGIVVGIIGEYILKNQKLCKLLYYYSDDKTPNYNPFLEPDIEDTTKLMFEHIFPLPKLPETTLNQQGYLTVTLTGGNSTDNLGYRRVNVQFDITYHLKQWAMSGGFRPYFVAEELDKMFNNQVLTIPTIGKSQYYGFRMKDYSSYYYGIQLIYELYVNSNVECNPQPIYAKTPFLGRIKTE